MSWSLVVKSLPEYEDRESPGDGSDAENPLTVNMYLLLSPATTNFEYAANRHSLFAPADSLRHMSTRSDTSESHHDIRACSLSLPSQKFSDRVPNPAFYSPQDL